VGGERDVPGAAADSGAHGHRVRCRGDRTSDNHKVRLLPASCEVSAVVDDALLGGSSDQLVWIG
jgi:hypothetical protein